MVDFVPIQIDLNAVVNATNAQIAFRASRLTADGSAQSVQQPSAQANAELAAGDPPWRSTEEVDTRAIARRALSIAPFIPDNVERDALAAPEDSPKLFALYDALERLKGLAQAIVDDQVQSSLYDRADTRFAEGLAEVSSFINAADFNSVNLVGGDQLTSAQTDVEIERRRYDYFTGVLFEGGFDDAVPAFAGHTGFTIDFTNSGGTTQIDIDLTALPDANRSINAVVDLINTGLESAGAVTRFEATKIGPLDENGVISGDDLGFKIAGTQTERLSFSASNAAPAIYLAGSAGAIENRAGQIAKYTDLDAASPTRAFVQRLEADTPPLEEEQTVADAPPNTKILATQAGPDGAVYTLIETEGEIDGQSLRGESDLALVKYDSTGKQIFTRVLGATTETEGLALAVAADGRVAIAGVTQGDLTEDAAGGGEDGFVTLYDSDGVELFTRQRASTLDDRIEALAFADDGSLFVAGRTSGAVGGASNSGGTDGFVEKLDTTGETLFSRQFGGAENDRITALAVDAAGGVVAASYEAGETVLRRFVSETADADDFTYNLGAGIVRDLEVSGGALYAAGETRLDGFSGGAFSGGGLTETDAFALRLDIAGASVSEAWFTRFGGDGDQASPALAVNGGDVFVAGSGATAFGSATVLGERNAYLARLDATTGAEAWAVALNGRADISSASGLAIDPTGGSTLDAFGLPSGEARIGDVNSVTDRTAARPGDHFFLSIDGGRRKQITIEAGDTYRDLTFKINAALVLDGNADIRSSNGSQSLRITPTDLVNVELFPGADGQDALSALRLPAGVLFREPFGSEDTASDAPELVALGIDFSIGVADKDEAQAAIEVLDSAQLAIRKAYRIATEDPTLQNLTDGAQATGTPPAYLQAQLANLQAGLQRLSSGSGSAGVFV